MDALGYIESMKCINCNVIISISKVQLSIEDIETILDTLIYDGKVERSIVATGASGDGSQTKLYRAVAPLIQPTGLMRVPCGVCPVSSVCHITTIHA